MSSPLEKLIGRLENEAEKSACPSARLVLRAIRLHETRRRIGALLTNGFSLTGFAPVPVRAVEISSVELLFEAPPGAESTSLVVSFDSATGEFISIFEPFWQTRARATHQVSPPLTLIEDEVETRSPLQAAQSGGANSAEEQVSSQARETGHSAQLIMFSVESHRFRSRRNHARRLAWPVGLVAVNDDQPPIDGGSAARNDLQQSDA